MEHDPSAPEITLRGKSRAKFLDYRRLERASFFLKHGQNMEFLRHGMTFQRPRAFNAVETARILSLMLDKQRVPHVRFEVTLRCGGQKDISNEGSRLLSLKVFAETYCENDASARIICNAPPRSGSLGRALRGGLRRLLPAASRRAGLVAAYPESPAINPARDDTQAGAFMKSA
jgi:hypothetical protein